MSARTEDWKVKAAVNGVAQREASLTEDPLVEVVEGYVAGGKAREGRQLLGHGRLRRDILGPRRHHGCGGGLLLGLLFCVY